MSGYIIMYWSRYKDVLWTQDTDTLDSDYDPNSDNDEDAGPDHTLAHHMMRFVTRGERAEILEYVPDADPSDGAGPRCEYWAAELRNLGYDMSGRDAYF